MNLTTVNGYAAIQTYGSKPVYVHRLVAFAYGEIDTLAEPVHIHHRDGVTWNNAPENLEAVEPEQHTGRHNRLRAD